MADKTDVAHTLADALKKIENILSEDRNQVHYLTNEAFYQNGHSEPVDLVSKIQNLTIDLASYVQKLDGAQCLGNNVHIPAETVNILAKWLHDLEVSIACPSHVLTWFT